MNTGKGVRAMEAGYIFESERLGFRRWKEEDRVLFEAMAADPDVMQFFPKLLNEEESNRLINRFEAHMDNKGYTMWAVERKKDGGFIGFIGLLEITMEIEGKGSAEIGWRLDKQFWKQGYAVEGALACISYAFGPLAMDQIYSFTSTINQASETVMRRVGMVKVGEFEHPKLDEDSPLKKHVLYKINRREKMDFDHLGD